MIETRTPRPVRRTGRGAKSDPIDAVRAAREALTREHLASASGGGRTGCSGGADDRSTLRGRSPHDHPASAARRWSTAAPETAPRSGSAGKSTKIVVSRRRRLRVDARWDIETPPPRKRDARRRAAMPRSRRPKPRPTKDRSSTRSSSLAAGPSRTTRCRTDRRGGRAVCVVASWTMPQRRRVREASPAWRRSKPRRDSRPGIASADCGDRQLNRALHVVAMSRLRYDAETQRLRASGDAPKARPTERSNAASSATSPGNCSGSSKPSPPPT